jgi:hypothetical protein
MFSFSINRGDLLSGLFHRARVIDHVIRALPFLLLRHLGRQTGGDLLRPHRTRLHQAFPPCNFVDGHDNDLITDIFRSGFIQQWDVQDDEGRIPKSGKELQLSFSHPWVNDLFEFTPRVGIGKDQPRHGTPIKGSIRIQHVRSEFPSYVKESRRAFSDNFARNLICTDDLRTEVSQMRRYRRLPAPERAGQAENHGQVPPSKLA